ncbi:hypothetical protein DGo_PB0416 (plasmid) [Deinococcus gobiensis I-0]|uniref:Uncharacterized protein n=1 Tax=Deinococcus gobiensis (strain DSM 21396 / JCM 16679 / CGMCC 1.7299 / I-0) TaxID=745776 RepID=H8H2D8_DEIGI|nr:hypothetical protein DGo_PB0416 [Deinococcus gobiensis I-0]
MSVTGLLRETTDSDPSEGGVLEPEKTRPLATPERLPRGHFLRHRGEI